MPDQDRLRGGTASDSVKDHGISVMPMRLEGQTLSLNFTMRALFKLPGAEFCLNATVPTAIVPNYLTDIQQHQIRVAIRRGELLVTDKPILKPSKKPEALSRQVNIIKTPGINMDVVEPMINSIVRMSDSDPKLGGHSRYQALEILFEAETDGQSRRSVLEYIASAMEYVPGARGVMDEPDTSRVPRHIPSTPIGETPTAEEIGEL